MSMVVFAALVVLAAATGALFRPGAWYETLRKPEWTPPKRAFPVVWMTLYAFIALAGWLVWREAGWSMPLALWGIQLALNAAWSWLFFGLRRMHAALANITALIGVLIAFIVAAHPISAAAAWLFVPYLAWVTVAATLNLRVLQLNPVEARRVAFPEPLALD